MNAGSQLRSMIAASALCVAALCQAQAQSNAGGIDYSGILLSLKQPASASAAAPKQRAPVAPVNAAPIGAHTGHGHAANAVSSTITCVSELAMVAERARVTFAAGSARLSQTHREGVMVLAKLAQKCPQARVLIEGYADPVGNQQINLALSWRRANVVMDAILEAGFSGENFEVSSHLVGHNDAQCRHFEAVDRRTEFVVNELGNG